MSRRTSIGTFARHDERALLEALQPARGTMLGNAVLKHQGVPVRLHTQARE